MMRLILATIAAVLALGTTAFTTIAQEPLWQDLRFVPSSGGCDGPFVVEGHGWPDGTVVLQIPGHQDVPPENAVDGHVRFELPSSTFEDICFPGSLLGVRAERLRPDASGARILADAFYEVPSPWSRMVTGCDGYRSFALSGFPPGEEVRLWVGGPPPLYADSLAPIETVRVDEFGSYTGEFEWPTPCVEDTQAPSPMWAGLADPSHPRARWAARANSTARVLPGGAGHGLIEPGPTCGIPLVLGVATLTLLAMARGVSRPGEEPRR